MKEFERKPDGGLNAWIETYEAMGGGENDAEMLCLLLELRRRRENQTEAECERDELRGEIDKIKILSRKRLSNACKAFARAEVAEAEIARRDAAAGEPVAWQYRYNNGTEQGDWKTVGSWGECNPHGRYEKRPLYTAAPPAVLPPVTNERDAFNNWNNEDNLPIAGVPAKNAAWLAWQARAALGAQQQKVVELPTPYDIGKGDRRYYDITAWHFDREELIAALDAAGVKWEVKK